MSMAGVILCDDLIFVSKVQGSARAHGIGMVQAKTIEACISTAAAVHATGVFVDIHHTGLNWYTFLPQLKSLPYHPKVIAFGSHVEVKALKAAREAGCDFVMPRSQFVKELEAQLPTWLAVREEAPAE